MFLGKFQHSIDGKGRLTIPSRYREMIGGQTLVVCKGFSGNLVVFTEESFMEYAQSLKTLRSTNPKEARIRRYITTSASEARLDPQGRILITQELRDAAGLKKDAVVTGNIDSFEIWSPERWAEVDDFEEADDLAGDIEELGIHL